MNKREEFGKKYIYCIFVLWLSFEIILNTTIESVLFWEKSDFNDYIAYIVLALLLVQIAFFQCYQIKEIIFIAVITVFISYATLKSGHNTMMSTWIFIVASKNINFEKLVGIAYYIELIAFGVVLYMFFNGYIRDYIIYRGAIARHSLGFSHPNQLGVRVFLIMVSRCYYRKDRLNALDILLPIISAIWINNIANSQTAFYALIILAVITAVYIFMNRFNYEMKAFSNLAIGVAMVSSFGSILLSLINVKKYPVLNALDLFMSKRFSHCYRTMKYYGIKFGGQEIELIVKRPIVGKIYHFWLDNAYMAMLLRYGIIVFTIFLFLYFVTLLYLKRTNQVYLLGIMSLYSVYGIMENNFFSMSHNLFLLTLSFPLFIHSNGSEHAGVFSKVKIVW